MRGDRSIAVPPHIVPFPVSGSEAAQFFSFLLLGIKRKEKKKTAVIFLIFLISAVMLTSFLFVCNVTLEIDNDQHCGVGAYVHYSSLSSLSEASVARMQGSSSAASFLR